jgi:hypothetical protein
LIPDGSPALLAELREAHPVFSGDGVLEDEEFIAQDPDSGAIHDPLER